VLNSEEQPHRP